MKTGAIIDARMTSSRLPGEVLTPTGGKPMSQILIERLQRVTELDAIVLATAINGLVRVSRARALHEIEREIVNAEDHALLKRAYEWISPTAPLLTAASS